MARSITGPCWAPLAHLATLSWAAILLVSLAGDALGTEPSQEDGGSGDEETQDPAPLDDDDDDDEEDAGEVMVVTGTRTERTRLDSPQATEVVSEEEIHEALPVTTVDLVADTPGVAVYNHGGVYYWNPVIRGLSGRRVIMLLDGDRIPTEKTMGITGVFVNTEDIAQVEVLRGPGSVMYGSDAIGGVVNIRLRDPFSEQGAYGWVGERASSNNRELAESATFGWSGERLALGASGRRRDAQSYVGGDGEEVANSFYHDTMFSGWMSLQPANAQTLTLRYAGLVVDEVGKAETEADREKHRLIRFPSDDVHRLSATWALEPGAGRLRTLHLSTYEQWTISDNEASIYDSGYESLVTQAVKHSEVRDLGGAGYATLALGDLGRLTVGTDASHKLLSISSTSTMFQPDGSSLTGDEQVEFDGATQGAVGFFMQDELDLLGPLAAILGVRYDAIHSYEGSVGGTSRSRTDGAVSGNLGLSLRTSPSTRLNANLGRAFRAPTLQEKFLVTTTCLGSMCGNPELEPEASWNLDLGVKGEPGPARFEVYGFGTWVEDFITAQTGLDIIDEDCEYTYTNTAQARLVGGEVLFEVKIPLNERWLYLQPRIVASYVRGDDVLNREPLPTIPPFSSTLSLRLGGRRFPALLRWFAEPELAWYAPQQHEAPDEDPSEGYVLLGLAGGLVLNGFWHVEEIDVNLKAINLLDSPYQSHLSMTPGMGRDVRLGVSFEF